MIIMGCTMNTNHWAGKLFVGFLLTSLSVMPESFSQARLHWTWLNPLPQGNNLRGVEKLAAGRYTVVGNSGTILSSANNEKQWEQKRVSSFGDYTSGSATGTLSYQPSFLIPPCNSPINPPSQEFPLQSGTIRVCRLKDMSRNVRRFNSGETKTSRPPDCGTGGIFVGAAGFEPATLRV